MNKKLIPLFLIFVSSLAGAQQYNALDQVRSDPRKAAGMEGPHRFDDIPAPTSAPKGYKPFYISHYGRHGSRYAWNPGTYTYLHDVLITAHTDGALTELGEEFYANFMDFFRMPLINSGDLVPLGWEQHKRIAEWTYDSFPQVFRKGRHIEAVVSTSARSIVSMSSFCLSLKEKEPGLDIYESSTHAGMTAAAPSSAPRELLRRFTEDEITGVESVSHFRDRIIDYEGILGRIFRNTAYPTRFEGGRSKFISELYSLLGGYHNYEDRPLFDNILTPDQYAMLWEASNYSSWYGDLNNRYKNIPLLEDIVEKAEAAFSDPVRAADLRFGHDYVLEAFVTLINANGCGITPNDASEVKYWFQSYNIPKAATILFVFYRDKKDDIIFKLIWNEKEAVLPQLSPVSGPYYRWSDFTDWVNGLKTAHPEIGN